jgi:hypothetical protein
VLYVFRVFLSIAVEGSEETWGVEDDDDLTDPIFDTIEVLFHHFICLSLFDFKIGFFFL